MKQNSQKILLLSYGLASVPLPSLKQAVETAILNLTSPGAQSLIQYLRKKQYLYVDAYTGLVSLTQQGIRLVEGLFPAFNPQNEVILVLFLKPPKHDPQFRTIRRILLSKHMKQLSRGVYIATGALHSEVSLTLERLYNGHVMVVKVDQWVLGDKKSVLADIFDEKAVFRTYSGVSRDVEQVISNSAGKKVLTEQNKEKICSAFTLFFDTLQADTRYDVTFAKDELNPRQVLGEFQKLLFYRPT